MRLGFNLCIPHRCQCGSDVDVQDHHVMVCRKAPGKIARHQVLNDIIWRALNTTGIPATKEPSGSNRHDGKHPDGLTDFNPMARWKLGNPWYGMSLLPERRLHPIQTLPLLAWDWWLIRKLPENSRSMQISSSSPLRWKTWGPSMLQHLSYYYYYIILGL